MRAPASLAWALALASELARLHAAGADTTEVRARLDDAACELAGNELFALEHAVRAALWGSH